MELIGRLRREAKAALRAVGRIRPLVPILYNDRVRALLWRFPGAGSLYGYGWDRLHPFDRQNGTDTSGVVLIETTAKETSDPALAHAQIYAPSQPSIVRAALDALPSLKDPTFIDLGCGKGRVLLIAAERPFRQVIGVELSPSMAKLARANAALMAARDPRRAPVVVEVGDASAYPLPPGDVVLFLYHSFGPPVLARVIGAIERAVAESRAVYVIYENPVHGALFDASSVLRRRWARNLPCPSHERGYGADLDDTVVIWQGGTAPPPTESTDGRIVLTNGGTRAELRS